MRPLPLAPRPFLDEALGSWIGRLAARYRMAVVQLDADYELGLGLKGPLAWLLPSPMSTTSLDRLCTLTRLPAAAISALATGETPARGQGTRYCRRCVFLNHLEIESPYWKRDWLLLGPPTCAVHDLQLTDLPAREVRGSQNMLTLIKRVGQQELERREAARSGGIGRIREPIRTI